MKAQLQPVKKARATNPTHVKPVTAKHRKLADAVKKHEFMLVTISEVFLDPRWRDDDKVGDRVPKDWRSKRPVGPIGKSTIIDDSDTNKRLKMGGPEWVGSLPIHPSAQLQPETPKRKEQERIARRAGLRSGAAWRKKL